MKNNVKKCLLATLSLSAVCALSVGALGMQSASAENTTLPANATVDMYLIGGQSNASGCSPKGTESQTFENVWYVGETCKTLSGANANANMGDATQYANVTVGMGENANNIGPEYGMAKILNEYYTNSDNKALIFKSAAGGTHLCDYEAGNDAIYGNWYPRSLWEWVEADPSVNAATDPTGVQYYNFVENFKTVYNELKAEGYTPVVKGMVWMQGCSDTGTPNYDDLLNAFISDIRTDIYQITEVEADKTMPIVIGEISTQVNADLASIERLVGVQQAVAAANTNAYTVPTKGLIIGTDGWHFTTESAVGLGERFGRALVKYADVTPTKDLMVTGASVYVGNKEEVGGVDKSGIRFQVLAKKELVDNGAEIGALLLPADMTEDTELTVKSVVNDGTITNEKIEKWFACEYEDYYQTYVYLYNFPVNDYNREILVNAYLKDGETYNYTGTISRSMSGVAFAAENAGEEGAENYIKSYHVNYYGEDGETEISGLENESARYGSLVEKPEISELNNKLLVNWYADKACTQKFDFKQAVKGTTNIYSKWAAGTEYALKADTYEMLPDATAAAGEGWVATVMMKGQDFAAATALERGGLRVHAADNDYPATFSISNWGTSDTSYLYLFTDQLSGTWDTVNGYKLNTYYPINQDVEMTVANYNNVLYFKIGDELITYSGSLESPWGSSYNYAKYQGASGLYMCNRDEQKLGVSGLWFDATVIVDYEIGNAAAKAMVKENFPGVVPMTLTGTYSYNSGRYEDGKYTNAGDTVTVTSGSYTGVVNADGTYSIDLPKGEHTLTFTSERFVDVTKAVTVSEDGAIDNVVFTTPKLEGTTGVTYTADSITLAANTNMLFAGDSTTMADEGYFVTFTISGSPAGSYNSRGGFYTVYNSEASAAWTKYYAEKASNQNSGNPVFKMYSSFKTWNGATYKTLGGDIGTNYDDAQPLTMTIAYCNKTIYIKVGDWMTKIVYADRANWQTSGNGMSGDIMGNSRLRSLGLMSQTYETTFTNVQYGIGDEIAQAEIAKTFSGV